MRRALVALVLVLALAGCETVSDGAPGGGAGSPARNGSMGDTERDAENLTRWCLTNGLCTPMVPPSYSTETTAEGNSW